MAIASETMILDPAIRDWVLFPIMIVMVLVGVLRHYATILLTPVPTRPKIKELRERQALAYCNLLHTRGDHLPITKFQARKQYFTEAIESGKYLKNGLVTDVKPKASNPLSDPSMMEGMMAGMKRNVAMVVPQTLIMSWINFFFSGFVLIQLPFPLTLRFKDMLQQGIYAPDMSVAYVSSLSWYFLNLFGLKAVFAIILGEENLADGVKDMQAMHMPHMQMQFGGQKDMAPKMFKDELENINLHIHRWNLNNVERRVLDKYQHLLK